MKILYLTPNFSNFFAATYDGMINSIAPYCDLKLYGPGYKIFDDMGFSRDISYVINCIYDGEKPDVIIIWDKEGSGWAGDFTNIENYDCLKVLWSVDIHNDAVPKTLDYIRKTGVNLILMTYDKKQITDSSKIFKTLGIPIEFYPFSIDPEMFKPMNLEKKYDVSLIGNMSSSYYPLRNEFHRKLLGNEFSYHHPDLGIYVRDGFARHINESKICVTGSSSYKYLVQKYYEVTACGTLLMADLPMDAEYQHFIPEYNFIEVSPSNILSKAKYYLENEEEANRIADNGRKTILQYHTHDIRGRDLMEILKKYV